MERGDFVSAEKGDAHNLIRVDNVEALTKEGVVYDKRCFGYPWKFRVYRGEGGAIGLAVFCDKTRESAVWECKAKGEVKLICPADGSKSDCKGFVYRRFAFSRDEPVILEFEDVIGNANFVVDGGVVFEVKIVVQWNGDVFRKRSLTDFSSPSRFSDAILSVQGQELYASKQILAHVSPYFSALFYGERNNNIVNVIEGVSFEEFKNVLELIYDTGMKVDEGNIESVLKVAAKFSIHKVTFFAEEELQYMMNLPLHYKLLLADQYNFYAVKAACLRHVKSLGDVTKSEFYARFPDALKIEMTAWVGYGFSDSSAKGQILEQRNVARLTREKPRLDFLTRSAFSDVVLVVGEKKIYTSKQILAHASPHFEELFFGNQADRNAKEFDIKGVSAEEVIGVLQMIYDNRKLVDDDCVEYLLKIAKEYQINGITDMCENFMCQFTEQEPHDQLRLADSYGLTVFMRRYLSSLQTMPDRLEGKSELTKIVNSSSFPGYSQDLKTKLTELSVLFEKKGADRGEE